MNEREKTIRLWFDMWLYQKDMGIDDIFTEDVLYTESWCPQYSNRKVVKHWFQEWNTRGKVVIWEIKQFFHKENQTIVGVLSMSVLQTIDLKKHYGAEPNITRALDGVNFSVDEGEFVAVVGTSGSGKSMRNMTRTG